MTFKKVSKFIRNHNIAVPLSLFFLILVIIWKLRPNPCEEDFNTIDLTRLQDASKFWPLFYPTDTNSEPIKSSRIFKLPSNYQTFNSITQELIIPSVIITIGGHGGLGNQLFQYAAAYTLAYKLKIPLYIEIDSDYVIEKISDSINYFKTRQFGLDKFNLSASSSFSSSAYSSKDNNNNPVVIKIYRKSSSSSNIYNYIPNHLKIILSEIHLLKLNYFPNDKIIFLDDYFESEIFFKEAKNNIQIQFQLKINEFLLSNSSSKFKAYLDEIHQLNYNNSSSSSSGQSPQQQSVAVHIRRGDIEKNPSNGRDLPITYQIKAMKLLLTKFLNWTAKFYIFSDDIQFVKTEFKRVEIFNNNNNNNPNISFVYVSNGKFTHWEEFYLMTQCKHIIIAHSTFSWWAAYLNAFKDKIVIAPFPRYTFKFLELEENNCLAREYKKYLYWNYAYPEDWILVNRFENYEQSINK